MSSQYQYQSEQLLFLLEDDMDDAYLIKVALSNDKVMKNNVAVFDSVEQIRNALNSFVPDLIIVDLNVPGSEGFDTMLSVKQAAPHIPIVVVTGSEDPLLGDRLIQLGAQDYIPKRELTPSLLQRVIRFSKERYQLLKVLEDSASRDNLTKLYNRKALDMKIAELIDHSNRYDETFALLFIDLNNFKPVNDKLGHDAGDQLLQHVASRLAMFSRSTDFVARYGGDEFVTMLPHVKSKEDAENAGRQQLKAITDDFFVSDAEGKAKKVSISASLGIALFGTNGNSAEELIKAADLAMYDAKKSNTLVAHAKSPNET